MAYEIGRSFLDEDWQDDDEDTQKDKYLTFCLAGEEYRIEIKYVTEIVSLQKITEVPEAVEYVRGVLNLRGNVIPVVDVRLRFHMKPREYDDRTCVIVVDFDDSPIGLVVDTVREVISIPEEQISLPSRMTTRLENRFIQGMGRVDDSVKILLDVKKLLDQTVLPGGEPPEEPMLTSLPGGKNAPPPDSSS